MKVLLKRKEKVKRKKKSAKQKNESGFGGELIEFIVELIIELIFD